MGIMFKIDFREIGCENLIQLDWFRIGSMAIVKIWVP
jgi:hypothetical protein